jgi:threonine/homoserine/homoserine lactone efflux protein
MELPSSYPMFLLASIALILVPGPAQALVIANSIASDCDHLCPQLSFSE